MKEPHIEGLATHDDPESCAGAREGVGEALTGARAGTVLSREIRHSGAPTPLSEAEGHTDPGRHGEPWIGPARSETRRTHGSLLRENRESPVSPAADGAAGRVGKAQCHTPTMHDAGQTDRPVVPTKPMNRAGQPAAESAEERGLTKGNTGGSQARRTQSRTHTPQALDRVRQAAAKDKRTRFTALLHHVTVERLRTAYFALKKNAAPGVDAVTWEHYGERLDERLRELHARVHQGAYRPKPSRRVYIPKADGRQRPLGIASLEDKVVQRAVVEVLNAIYESDFLGFSYGFRPQRSQHDALDALAVGLLRKRVNWVLDADIRGYFDAIDHGWLVKFVEHRVGDKRVVRLIQQWLAAGVMENGEWAASTMGSPQGATVSPLLANLYLHYALDLWVQRWRTSQARGDVIVVRYADDFIIGFEHRSDAERFQEELRDRLATFRLELHPTKTRLIAFGKFALLRRRERGEAGTPETFNFLGLTHICGRSRAGRFLLRRHTERRRLTAKLREVKTELQRRRHFPIPEQGRWLRAVVRGHAAYYGVPTNAHRVRAFRTLVARQWHRSLNRRSQRGRRPWSRMRRLVDRWLPMPHPEHPWPEQRFDGRTQGKSPVR